MKYLYLMVFLPLFSLSAQADQQVLETAGFNISITSNCQEGDVVCSDLLYEGVSKKSGNAIQLKGSSWHTTCADKVTPCRFLGYQFKNGNTTYYVHQDGLLQVIQGRYKVIVIEQGVWQ